MTASPVREWASGGGSRRSPCTSTGHRSIRPDGVRLHRGHRGGQTPAGRCRAAGSIATARRGGGDQPAELHAGHHHQVAGTGQLAIGESRSRTRSLADRQGIGARCRLSGRWAVADQRLLRPDPHTRIRRPAGCTSSPTTSTAAHRCGLFRVPPKEFTDRAKWQGWSATAGWNRPPTPLWGDRVGEMSIRQIDGKAVLSYFNVEHRKHGGPCRRRSDRARYRPGHHGGSRRRVARPGRERCRIPATTPWRSRTGATSRRGRRSTRCGCSSASGTPRSRDRAPYRVIQFAVNPFKR